MKKKELLAKIEALEIRIAFLEEWRLHPSTAPIHPICPGYPLEPFYPHVPLEPYYGIPYWRNPVTSISGGK